MLKISGAAAHLLHKYVGGVLCCEQCRPFAAHRVEVRSAFSHVMSYKTNFVEILKLKIDHVKNVVARLL